MSFWPFLSESSSDHKETKTIALPEGVVLAKPADRKKSTDNDHLNISTRTKTQIKETNNSENEDLESTHSDQSENASVDLKTLVDNNDLSLLSASNEKPEGSDLLEESSGKLVSENNESDILPEHSIQFSEKTDFNDPELQALAPFDDKPENDCPQKFSSNQLSIDLNPPEKSIRFGDEAMDNDFSNLYAHPIGVSELELTKLSETLDIANVTVGFESIDLVAPETALNEAQAVLSDNSFNDLCSDFNTNASLLEAASKQLDAHSQSTSNQPDLTASNSFFYEILDDLASNDDFALESLEDYSDYLEEHTTKAENPVNNAGDEATLQSWTPDVDYFFDAVQSEKNEAPNEKPETKSEGKNQNTSHYSEQTDPNKNLTQESAESNGSHLLESNLTFEPAFDEMQPVPPLDAFPPPHTSDDLFQEFVSETNKMAVFPLPMVDFEDQTNPDDAFTNFNDSEIDHFNGFEPVVAPPPPLPFDNSTEALPEAYETQATEESNRVEESDTVSEFAVGQEFAKKGPSEATAQPNPVDPTGVTAGYSGPKCEEHSVSQVFSDETNNNINNDSLSAGLFNEKPVTYQASTYSAKEIGDDASSESEALETAEWEGAENKKNTLKSTELKSSSGWNAKLMLQSVETLENRQLLQKSRYVTHCINALVNQYFET
ncbi:MAG: hypothetical protein AAGI66_00665 [Cyanobacteria bacterium P01_H01_bin.74]